jgi:exportin-T
LPEPESADDNVLAKATVGRSYFADQLHLFEAAGVLVRLAKVDPQRQMAYLEAVAGPLMATMGTALERYKQAPNDLLAVLQVHHQLMALGNFAKGFPTLSDDQIEALAYQPAFKQMTEALLQALNVMKTQRVVRDAVSFVAMWRYLLTIVGEILLLAVCQRYRHHCGRAGTNVCPACGDRVRVV